ncbi:MAG: response regulator [Deltaproteobacteria bacterium]|jgi:DNA-binding response OmpR family regulator|nr:response regulator [Deltaproteobacteria bacterium]
MTASVLLLIDDQQLRDKLTGYLAGDRFVVTQGQALTSSSQVAATIAQIAAANPNLVIMDYLGEDEASVKVLQSFVDLGPGVDFIFVDSARQAEPDKIMLAFNEGVRAFLSPDISAVGLVNYVTRALEGPARFRGGFARPDSDGGSPSLGGDSHGRLRSRLDSSLKLIAYLLSTPLNAQPRKTLVLSDSPYQRELLRKHLEDHNFTVLTAANFDDAVTLTLTEKPRTIISDYTLDDGKTGLDFCQALKFANKYTPCYFVVCTANMDKFSEIMTPGNGVDDCVLKPSPTSSLNEFLASVAAGLLL